MCYVALEQSQNVVILELEVFIKFVTKNVSSPSHCDINLAPDSKLVAAK